MASRNELVIRANAVGITVANYPNDSKLEQKILYLEKNGTAYAGAKGVQTLTISGADVAAADTVRIGNRTYTFRASLTGVKASSMLTNATSFSAGETVTIDGRTYTFVVTPVEMNQVAIGGNVATSLDNLKQAINQGNEVWPAAATNEGLGTNYGAQTVRHHSVTATTNSATEQTVEAKIAGLKGNSFVVAETGATAAWAGSVLASGVEPVADEIKIGSSAAETLDFLKDAINAGVVATTEGAGYFVGGKAHEQVTATTNSATQQVIEARDSAFDNASIAVVIAGGGNIATGAASLASGVSTVISTGTSTATGAPGVSGDKNI